MANLASGPTPNRFILPSKLQSCLHQSAPSGSGPDQYERVVSAAAQNASDLAHSEFFYRQLALHMAKEATTDFKRVGGPLDVDGAAAVHAFLRHEQDLGRLRTGEIAAQGSGFRVKANVHSCPFEGTCRGNLKAVGEVPQCLRAITLIEAISAKIPQRPPMTYDLAPGLVDRTADSCEIKLRPAGIPDVSVQPGPPQR